MNKHTILEHDVILENLKPGQGKVIIAGPTLNTSYYWGSMGSSLEEFICSIDLGYWTKNLLPYDVERPVDTRKTFAAFRKQLKENLGYELIGYGWWKEMEFQEQMRKEIQKAQDSTEGDHSFMYILNSLPGKMPYSLIRDRYDQKVFEETIEMTCAEPWHYLVHGQSREEKILAEIYSVLRKRLK